MAASSSKQSESDTHSHPVSQHSNRKRKGKEKEKVPSKAIPNAQNATTWDSDEQWNWTSLTDPSSSRIPPVFTKDGSYFFSLVGSSIKIHSVATGQVVSTMTSPSPSGHTHSDMLTCAIINPHNSFQLITGSLDGKLMIWDFVNATLLRTADIGQPIHYLSAHEQFQGSVFVVVSRPSKRLEARDNTAAVLQVILTLNDPMNQPAKVCAIGKTRSPTGLALSPDGQWLVVTAGHKVYIAKTSSLSSGFTKYVSPERLTCLAFHPSEEYFATGDGKGNVRLWYCLNDSLAVNVKGVEKRTQTRSLHWHAHTVSSLAFSRNGAYLLSGGEESVLVIWQLHTGKKEFVPRVGAPINTISVAKLSTGEEEYLLGLADATYSFVSSATLKITRSYSRIKIDPTVSYEWPSTPGIDSIPLAIQPLTSTLILPSSHPSSLQIYSPCTSTLISELEVSPSNKISRRDDKPMIPARVEKITVSPSGQWMATVDSRPADSTFHAEVYLKFWLWDKKDATWMLHTRVDHPHGTESVTDIAFSPLAHKDATSFLVSIGCNGCVKVWRVKRHQSGSDATDVWISHASWSFRLEMPTSISWSPDASLFAISVGSHVALYDPTNHLIPQTFTTSKKSEISKVMFVGSHGRFLLTVERTRLTLWDLIDNSVSWQTDLHEPITNVISHPMDSRFGVFCSSNIGLQTRISIFHSASPIPTASYTLPFRLKNTIWDSLKGDSGFNFIGLTSSWKVVSFGDGSSFHSDDTLNLKSIIGQRRPVTKTLFQDIFGASAFADIDPPSSQTSSTSPQFSRQRGHDAIYTDPVYLAPSMIDLFDPLIHTFLHKRSLDVFSFPQNGHEDDEDVFMADVGLEPATLTRQPARTPGVQEMEIFTRLFKEHTMNTVVHLNSKPPNGVHRKGVNGSPHTSNAIVSPTPVKEPVVPARIRSAVASPLLNGKKRKKPVG